MNSSALQLDARVDIGGDHGHSVRSDSGSPLQSTSEQSGLIENCENSVFIERIRLVYQ